MVLSLTANKPLKFVYASVKAKWYFILNNKKTEEHKVTQQKNLAELFLKMTGILL